MTLRPLRALSTSAVISPLRCHASAMRPAVIMPEQRRLGVRDFAMTGSDAQGVRHRRPPEFYICPSCGTLTIYSVARDADGKPVYDCAKCRRPFDEETLEAHHRERRSFAETSPPHPECK